ncbi:MAG: hypothetical protein Alis3KO_41350 [Aliiglaciecola sp.]
MKLQKCPYCNEHQKVSNLLFLSAHNKKECHSCGSFYRLNFGKSLPYMIFAIVPCLIISGMSFEFGFGNLALAFIWLFASMLFYLKRVPLVKDDV